MRRTDRECADPDFIAAVLARAETLFLALDDHGSPYCIPVNYAIKDSAIYIHSATSGLKLDCIAANPAVGFSAAIDIEIDQKRFTTWYKSVAGRGRASVVTDKKEKQEALDLIAIRYQAYCPRPASESAINSVAIIRIDITEVTGKRHLRQGMQQE